MFGFGSKEKEKEKEEEYDLGEILRIMDRHKSEVIDCYTSSHGVVRIAKIEKEEGSRIHVLKKESLDEALRVMDKLGLKELVHCHYYDTLRLTIKGFPEEWQADVG